MRHHSRHNLEAAAKRQERARRRKSQKSACKLHRLGFQELPGYKLFKHEFRAMLGNRLDTKTIAARQNSKHIQSKNKHQQYRL